MREPLQIWFDKWIAKYANSSARFQRNAHEQIVFVHQDLGELIWTDVPYLKRENEDNSRSSCRKITGYVIGEYQSKGVQLPIYLFERTDLGIQFVMRGNGLDWKLSVMSERPIESDLFSCLFHTRPPIEPEYTGNELAACFFNGFPPGSHLRLSLRKPLSVVGLPQSTGPVDCDLSLPA